MADEKSNPDPSARYQELVTQWERETDKFLNQLMGTEQFSKSMNQMQQLHLEWQKNFRDLMAGYLQNMNMPSRDDVLQLGDEIRELNDRLVQIEEHVKKLAGESGHPGQAARKRPPRTRKPPKKSE